MQKPNQDSTMAPHSSSSSLTTCLYNTELGLAALTWCRHVIGRSLHLDLQDFSFRLQIQPFLFWKKHGSKIFNPTKESRKIEVHWDLAKAKFGSGSEPQSGYYVAVIVDGEMTLLVGDRHEEAYFRTGARKPERISQALILRREHVFGNKFYTTKARFGGKTREISIDCKIGDEPRLCISVDGIRVLQVKQLKWKFRGNERVEIEGVNVQVSWDVFNWLFEDVDDRHAVFMFKFDEEQRGEELNEKNREMVVWRSGNLGMSSVERRKLKKSSFKTRSSSSSSISSVSSACSSSVMEWTSKEESELQSKSGFSLLVYAWKS